MLAVGMEKIAIQHDVPDNLADTIREADEQGDLILRIDRGDR